MLCVLYYIDVTYPPQAKYTQNKQAFFLKVSLLREFACFLHKANFTVYLIRHYTPKAYSAL